MDSESNTNEPFCGVSKIFQSSGNINLNHILKSRCNISYVIFNALPILFFFFLPIGSFLTLMNLLTLMHLLKLMNFFHQSNDA